ncbi:MAG TPA: hypothetical protein VGM75_14810 [Pseudonocardiaceae bacterium]
MSSIHQQTDVPARVEAIAEGGGWSVCMPGLPIAADGETFDDAVTEMVAAPREYARDWCDHLADAPKHRENGPLVELVGRGDDEQLRDWLVRAARGGDATCSWPGSGPRRRC